MSDQSPYEKLGVSEDASFDEIQNVRNRLLDGYTGDVKGRESIEMAYDAILMDRLRMRQEGKIKVPERIRFPEKLVQSSLPESKPVYEPSASWLQGAIDKPSLTDVVLPLISYSGLSAFCLFYSANPSQFLQLALIVGFCISVYFIHRKESRFGRAVSLSFIGLFTGLILGSILSFLIPVQLLQPFSPDQFSAVLTFIVFWLVSSFLR